LILDPACGDGALLLSIGEKMNKENKQFRLLGFDTNPNYIDKAKQVLSENIKVDCKLKHADFLESIDLVRSENLLFSEN